MLFFLNLAKNRVLGIFCFFEIVRKVLEREWVIVKFKNVLKSTSNFNSHIIKKTFGLIYSFLRGIDWWNLKYFFQKITRYILLTLIWIHSRIFFVIVLDGSLGLFCFSGNFFCCSFKFHHYFCPQFCMKSWKTPQKRTDDLENLQWWYIFFYLEDFGN